MMRQRYQTLKKAASAEIVEKKSRFIAQCTPVEEEEAAVAFIGQIRKDHRLAAHHVYAYALRKDGIRRYSDDGEPQGTAGLPVLEVLTRRGIEDAAVVVTRYFGGTLLGTGGLVRAYSEAAALAAEAAEIVPMQCCSVYEISCEYAWYERLKKLLDQAQAKILQSSYAEKILMSVVVQSDTAFRLIGDVTELTRGTSLPKHVGDRYFSAEEMLTKEKGFGP